MFKEPMMQRDDRWTGSDENLERLLAAASRALPEEDFTAAVMKVVRRSARRRRMRVWVIAAALAAGVVLALGPLVELATAARSLMATLAWNDDAFRAELVASTRMYSMQVLAVLACGLGWPILARWISR
jgi:anti-sigma factor RsiW